MDHGDEDALIATCMSRAGQVVALAAARPIAGGATVSTVC
jgi:hypothetical protein